MKKLNYIWIALLISSCGQEITGNATTETDGEMPASEIVDSTLNGGQSLNCTGTVEVLPEARVSIHVPIKGILNQISVREGDRVKKGQVLARIEHIEILQLQERYYKSKSTYTFQTEEFERKSKLFNEGVISRKEYQQNEAEFLVAKAEYESLKKQLEFLGIPVNNASPGSITQGLSLRSPIDGYVVRVMGNNGMYADQDKQLFDLVDDSKMYLHLQVFSSDIGRVKVGQKVHFSLAGNDDSFTAEIDLIGKAVDPANRTVPVMAKILNGKEHLVVGGSIFAEIDTQE